MIQIYNFIVIFSFFFLMTDPTSLASLLSSSLSSLLPHLPARKHGAVSSALGLVLTEVRARERLGVSNLPSTHSSVSTTVSGMSTGNGSNGMDVQRGNGNGGGNSSGWMDTIGKMQRESNADRYFVVLKMACETKVPKVMEGVLDCVQKLVAYGYLRGESAVDRTQYPLDGAGKDSVEPDISNTNGRSRKLIDIIVETVYDSSSYQDDGVQLQVIKVLLTIVTSNTCQVHEHNLMLAIRACYHIHLTSFNLINRTTAKASLTQMLNILFQNMDVATSEYELSLERALQQERTDRQGSNISVERNGS